MTNMGTGTEVAVGASVGVSISVGVRKVASERFRSTVADHAHLNWTYFFCLDLDSTYI